MMKRNPIIELSKQYCEELDKVGFDETESLKRIHFMKKLSEAKNLANIQILGKAQSQIEKNLVGSQSDGSGINHFNDLDVLLTDHAILCQNEDNCNKHENDNVPVVFQADLRNAPAGYVYLKFLKGESETYTQLEHALVERNNQKYLSSNDYLYIKENISPNNQGYSGQVTEQLSRVGPSIPKNTKQSSSAAWILSRLNLQVMDTDVVWAFPYNARLTIEEWNCRKRKYGWPNKETIAKVASLPAHVVPVGQKGTKDEHLQWRICFTLGEIHLVQNFSNVQRKLYVLMKLIAKHFLKTICNDISSYVIKNVLFWILEENPAEKFNEENFLEILQDTLSYLLRAIERKTLQNYMIPSRNLFEGKFEKNNLCMHDLTKMILKCINEPDTLLNIMGQIFSDMKMGHLLEITERTILGSLSTEELVEMYVKMNSCQSQESMISLNIQYKAIPFWNLFGKKWLSEHSSPTETHVVNFEIDSRCFVESHSEKWLSPSSSLLLKVDDVMDKRSWRQQCFDCFTMYSYL